MERKDCWDADEKPAVAVDKYWLAVELPEAQRMAMAEQSNIWHACWGWQ
jgi:hypothetical protein